MPARSARFLKSAITVSGNLILMTVVFRPLVIVVPLSYYTIQTREDFVKTLSLVTL